MRTRLIIFLIWYVGVFSAINLAFSQEKQSVATHLQDISVTIRSSGGEGSGVVFTRTNSSGELINFIWTAAHVVADLRSEREMVSEGNKKTMVEFQDAKIIKEIIENGRRVGKLELDAEVIKYSNADNGEDLALLRLRKTGFVKSSVKFCEEDKIPELGTELYHVGSLLGQMGASSMTSGIYSQVGRIINKNIYDQTTCAAFGGSSGGGIYLRDGRYVGMVVRGAGETFNLVVPMRRIKAWTKKNHIEWAINQNIPLPTDDEIKIIQIEDIFPKFSK